MDGLADPVLLLCSGLLRGPRPCHSGEPIPMEVPDQGPRQGDGRSQALHVATDIQLYLCDPQNPWQRGTNENTNGQLRRYLPKGIDISSYSQAKLNAVARQLNYKGFPPSQALAGLDVSLSDASRRIKVRIGHWPPCRHASAQRTRVRTAKLQPVMLQRSMLRTLMEDARRGSIR